MSTAPDASFGDHFRDLTLTDMRVALDVEIPSDVNEIERVVELVRRECEEIRLPPRACSLNIPVALTEAISNAILRGNREDGAKHVRVRALLDAQRLVLEVEDEGEGFDFEHTVIDPTTPDQLEREDGRGLFLMRKLMDRVERFTRDGNVVRLTLIRR